MGSQKPVHHHISYWTILVLVVFVMSLSIHMMLSGVSERDKSITNIDPVNIDEYSMDLRPGIDKRIPNLDSDMQQESIEKILLESIDDRDAGFDRRMYTYKKEGRKDPFDSSSALGDIMASSEVEKPLSFKRNPIHLSKSKVLYWYDNCSIFASTSKYCYYVGYNRGNPYHAITDINKSVKFDNKGQYSTCWWVLEYGVMDKKRWYFPLDDDTLMMLVDKRCKDMSKQR